MFCYKYDTFVLIDGGYESILLANSIHAWLQCTHEEEWNKYLHFVHLLNLRLDSGFYSSVDYKSFAVYKPLHIKWNQPCHQMEFVIFAYVYCTLHPCSDSVCQMGKN